MANSNRVNVFINTLISLLYLFVVIKLYQLDEYWASIFIFVAFLFLSLVSRKFFYKITNLSINNYVRLLMIVFFTAYGSYEYNLLYSSNKDQEAKLDNVEFQKKASNAKAINETSLKKTNSSSKNNKELNNSNRKKNQRKEDIFIHKENEKVEINGVVYMVNASLFSSKISNNPLLKTKPSAKYLLVAMTILNKTKKPITIPEFNLIDESGYEYETSSDCIWLEDSITFFERLNPNIEKKGIVLFDVPVDRTYFLKFKNIGHDDIMDKIKLSPRGN